MRSPDSRRGRALFLSASVPKCTRGNPPCIFEIRTMSSIWNTIAPTYVGWFNASTEHEPEVLRYWNGASWSAPCYADDFARCSRRARNTRGESQFPDVKWREPDLREMSDASLESLSEGLWRESDAEGEARSGPPTVASAGAALQCAKRLMALVHERRLRLTVVT